MTAHRPFIATYILASGQNRTLYIGVTSDLYARVWRHKTGFHDGFTAEHGCIRLVWFEQYDLITEAIRREKRLKKWLRDWKLKLIEEANPQWLDLSADWYPADTQEWTPPSEAG